MDNNKIDNSKTKMNTGTKRIIKLIVSFIMTIGFMYLFYLSTIKPDFIETLIIGFMCLMGIGFIWFIIFGIIGGFND